MSGSGGASNELPLAAGANPTHARRLNVKHQGSAMIVIAGVSGHVGSTAATELLSKKAKIKVLVRDAKKGESWSQRGAEVAVTSLDDQAGLTAALKGATGFFALLPPNFGTQALYADQRKQADTIAAAVKDAGVPHVVLLSSIGADVAEGNGPIKGLNYLEKVLREAGTKLTAIRAGAFQENVAHAIAPATKMGMYFNFAPSADYPMPQIATHDIGMLVASSLLDPSAKSEVVDLHGPAYSNRQVAEKLGTRLGKTLKIVDIAPADYVATLLQAGMPPEWANAYAEMYNGFGSGKLRPIGDRLVEGKTTLDATLDQLVPKA